VPTAREAREGVAGRWEIGGGRGREREGKEGGRGWRGKAPGREGLGNAEMSTCLMLTVIITFQGEEEKDGYSVGGFTANDAFSKIHWPTDLSNFRSFMSTVSVIRWSQGLQLIKRRSELLLCCCVGLVFHPTNPLWVKIILI